MGKFLDLGEIQHSGLAYCYCVHTDFLKICLFDHVIFLNFSLSQFLHLEMENDNNGSNVVLHAFRMLFKNLVFFLEPL